MGYSWWRERHRQEMVWERRGGPCGAPGSTRTGGLASEERPLALELGRKLLFIFATALATALAKNSVRTLVPPSPPQPSKQENKRMGQHLLQQEARA